MIYKKICFVLFSVMCIFLNGFLIIAADVNSILSLLNSPIAGFSLPANLVAQANAYLLAHPDINYDALESEVINALGVIRTAVQGKDVKSISDIAKCISPEQKKAIISNLQSAANTAKVAIALDKNDQGEDSVTVVDKTSGTAVFTQESIIKSTGRSPQISLMNLKISLFIIISFIEGVFIFKYYRLKNVM